MGTCGTHTQKQLINCSNITVHCIQIFKCFHLKQNICKGGKKPKCNLSNYLKIGNSINDSMSPPVLQVKSMPHNWFPTSERINVFIQHVHMSRTGHNSSYVTLPCFCWMRCYQSTKYLLLNPNEDVKWRVTALYCWK